MTIIRLNCALLTIEGLIALALSAYWKSTSSPNGTVSLLSWSWSTPEALRLLAWIGAGSFLVGIFGGLGSHIVIRIRTKRKVNLIHTMAARARGHVPREAPPADATTPSSSVEGQTECPPITLPVLVPIASYSPDKPSGSVPDTFPQAAEKAMAGTAGNANPGMLHPIPEAHALTGTLTASVSNASRSNAVILAGALGLFLAFFLPWLQFGQVELAGYSLPTNVSAMSSAGKVPLSVQLYKVLYFIPLLSFLSLFAELTRPRRRCTTHLVAALCCLLVLALFVVTTKALLPSGIFAPQDSVFAMLGAGWYVVLVGALTVLIGTALSRD